MGWGAGNVSLAALSTAMGLLLQCVREKPPEVGFLQLWPGFVPWWQALEVLWLCWGPTGCLHPRPQLPSPAAGAAAPALQGLISPVLPSAERCTRPLPWRRRQMLRGLISSKRLREWGGSSSGLPHLPAGGEEWHPCSLPIVRGRDPVGAAAYIVPTSAPALGWCCPRPSHHNLPAPLCLWLWAL